MKKIHILKKHLYIMIVAIFSLAIPEISNAADFSIHGYYRVRAVGNYDLDLQHSNSTIPYNNNRFGFIEYNQMRLRLEPNFKLNDNLSIHAQFDVLDNVLFGTNEPKQLNIIAPVVGPQTLPVGAGSFYMSGPTTVGAGGAINIRRIWADILTPIGKFRIGRQPSHWGLGIFQNDGNELQGNFGDTADRILYLIQKEIIDVGAITGGLLWDIAYQAQWDPTTNASWTGSPSNPMPSFSRNAQQIAGMVMFDNPDYAAGVFGGIRRRKGPTGATTMTVTDALGNQTAAGIDGYTLLYFTDLYARMNWKNYKFALEGVYIGGTVTTGLALNAIPFKGLGAGTQGIIQLPAKQTMRVFNAAFEAEGTYNFGGTWKFQTGFAEGDGTPLSQRVTQLGFRPDYQIALMMFYTPLGTSPSLYGQNATNPTGATVYLAGGQPVTGNYINNALYFAGGYKHKFELENTGWANWVKVGGKVITAWAPKKNTNINFSDLISQAGNWPSISETAGTIWKRWYGLEVDVSGEAKLWDHFYAALEGGVLIPGREYNVEVDLFDPGSIVEPIPRDKAEMAWLVRLSTILEF